MKKLFIITIISILPALSFAATSVICRCSYMLSSEEIDFNTSLADLEKYHMYTQCFSRKDGKFDESFSIDFKEGSFQMHLNDKFGTPIKRAPVATAGTVVEMASSDLSAVYSCSLQ